MEHELEYLRQEAAENRNTTATAYFMERAEKYLTQGETELARASLILLCEYCSNYEESLEWHGLTESWLKHRHLVEGLVPPSVQFCSVQPLSPQECSMQIAEIIGLPDAELLSALSDHLSELSASGAALSRLNKWERTAYYADELCAEVNSGGFNGYLYYHGTHFEKVYKAMEAISANGVLRILDSVRGRFPRNRIPKTEAALQSTMDAMEEQGVDFEQEDDCFYAVGEKELLEHLLTFILENQNRFR